MATGRDAPAARRSSAQCWGLHGRHGTFSRGHCARSSAERQAVSVALERKPREPLARSGAFWGATGALDAPRRDAVNVGALLRVLLLTGQRAGETAGMRWAEIDMERRQWTIPARRTKNGKEHVVALSALAIEVLEALPRDRDLVFSATGKVPSPGFGWAKAKLDNAMSAEEPWVIHDLRRTATTVMARLGVAPHVADRVLNHTAGTIRGVARVYNQFEYRDERATALEALGRYIENLVRPGGGNVVSLRRAQSA